MKVYVDDAIIKKKTVGRLDPRFPRNFRDYKDAQAKAQPEKMCLWGLALHVLRVHGEKKRH